MTEFILKSTISLSVLLTVYHLFLEKEKMHRFNRYYLLSALVLSMITPFINFTIYSKTTTEPIPVVYAEKMPMESALPASANEPFIAIQDVLLLLYFLIWGIMAFKFILGISSYIKKIKHNKKIKFKEATLVLLKPDVLPHTFLNYIFINEKEYQENLIEEDLYTHELTHVRQKHTYDILFIETIKIFYWFNPLFYFYKKAIQLNHEFLADENVIKSKDSAVAYQQLLLDRASSGTIYPLASCINFSVTKKRFMMMTKFTSKVKAATLKTALAPVISGLLFILCTRTVAQTTGSLAMLEKDPELIEMFWTTKFTIEDKHGNKTEKKFHDLTKEEKKHLFRMLPPGPVQRDTPTLQQLEQWKDSRYVIKMDSKYIPNDRLNEYKPEDIAVYYKVSPDSISLFTEKYFKTTFLDRNTITNYSKLTKMSFVFDETDEKAKEALKNELFVEDLTKQPEFEGGQQAFYKYISENFVIPHDVTRDLKIYVSFYIEEDGTLTNPYIMRVSQGHNTGMEIKKVLLKSPRWSPGEKDGKPVRVNYILPIEIKIKR